MCDLLVNVFFKQKTAYEMRISDWSSDVCSSDLFVLDLPRSQYENNRRLGITNRTEWEVSDAITLINIFGYRDTRVGYNTESGTGRAIADGSGAFPAGTPVDLIIASLDNAVHQYSDEFQVHGKMLDDRLSWRSEEHTSELQSLMRISYAVFC